MGNGEDTVRRIAPAEVAWAVSLTLGPGRHLLPDETRGDEPGPFLAAMPATDAELDLLETALHDAGRPHRVRTTGDAVDVLAALKPAELFTISRALWAILADRADIREYTRAGAAGGDGIPVTRQSRRRRDGTRQRTSGRWRR